MNSSGITPKGYTLLIELDPVNDKEGFLAKTEQKIEAERLSQTNATVIAIGPQAWKEESEPRCQVGDKIIFRLYAGEMKTGNDGKKYRIIDDQSVYATKEA